MQLSAHEIAALGSHVRSWREQAGLSQAGLARGLGTTQSAVSRWENGHDEPRLSTIAALLRACGLTGVLDVAPDVDRELILQQLSMTPRERLDALANMSRLTAARR